MVSCCNEEQTAFGILYLVYLTLALVALDSILVKPMRLMATLVRDMSLAIMCWLSCGRVHNNEVRDSKFRGGFKYLITMASYLGEAFWGMMFTIMSGGRRTATWAAGGLCVALISALFYIPNRKRMILNICYCILIVTLIAIEWFIFTPILAYAVLFFGVFLSTYALADIYGVAIQPLRVGSDAYVLHEERLVLLFSYEAPKTSYLFIVSISYHLIVLSYQQCNLYCIPYLLLTL